MIRPFLALDILAGFLIGCAGAPIATDRPPRPVEVRPFRLGEPDAVVLVTGSTHGTLEVCDCTGPMPGGLARRSGLLASYRHAFPHALLIDTGDFFWIEPGDLRNRYVTLGYRMLGYDAVVLGDQEWAERDLPLADILAEGPAVLSSTVRPADPPAGWAPLDVLSHVTPQAKLAVVSDLRPDALLFFEQARRDELRFDDPRDLPARIAQLQQGGWCVLAVVHGSESDLRKAVPRLNADLFLRGHTEQAPEALLRIAGKPVLQVGGRQFVGVLAMKINQDGRIEQIEYRREVVDDHWPLDRRFLALFKRYLKQRVARARAESAP